MSYPIIFYPDWEDGEYPCDECGENVLDEGILIKEIVGLQPKRKMLCMKCGVNKLLLSSYWRIEFEWYRDKTPMHIIKRRKSNYGATYNSNRRKGMTRSERRQIK